MTKDERATLFNELRRIGDETKKFNYIPGRFLQDLANSDPGELIARYVLTSRPSAGFLRLCEEGRLDLAVENVAWRFRHLLSPEIATAAEKRLRSAEFDVNTQSVVRPGRGPGSR